MQKWTAPTGVIISYSSPAVGTFGFSSPSVTAAVTYAIVYVGSGDGKLYAFNWTTGALIWSAPTSAAIDSSPAAMVVAHSFPFTSVTYMVLVGSSDNKLHAFDAFNGAPLWSATTGGIILSSPAEDGSLVYVGSQDGKLYAFDPLTCQGNFSCPPVWTATTGGATSSSPAVAYGSNANGHAVYVGSQDNKLYAFNAVTGALLWSKATGGVINSSPSVSQWIGICRLG